MSITKAVLLTLLIVAIEYSIQAISFIGFDVSGFSYDFDHLFGITLILCRVIAYTTVLYFFWTKDLIKSKIQIQGFDPKIFIYLILMTLGLRFMGEPFWDYNQIFRAAEFSFYSFDGITLQFIYRSILTLVLAPVLEELFFRKFLISKLLEKYRKVTAILTSATLFAAIHWETVLNLIPAFFFGIIGGIIFLKTKKIIYLILLHFLYNLLGLIIIVNWFNYSEVIQWLNYGILYWSLFVFGIFITLFVLRQIPSQVRNHVYPVQ